MHCDMNIPVSKDTNTLTNKEYVRELHLHWLIKKETLQAKSW